MSILCNVCGLVLCRWVLMLFSVDLDCVVFDSWCLMFCRLWLSRFSEDSRCCY